MKNKDLFSLEVYKLSLNLSDLGWLIYQGLQNNIKYSTGRQFLSSTDSIGANIAEGYGRYHYKDCLKFYYNSRGSLWESRFWIELLKRRNLVTEELHNKYIEIITELGFKLNNFISAIRKLENTKTE